MKKIMCVIGVMLASNVGLYSQVLEDFNHGSENISHSNCWAVQGDVRTESWGINSAPDRPMLVSNIFSGTRVSKSPYVKFNGTGVVNFKHVVNNISSGPRLEVFLVDTAGAQVQTLLAHKYTSNAVLSESISVQWTGIYQIKWKWTATGGTSRSGIDDISINGSYASDSSQSDSFGNCPHMAILTDTVCEGQLNEPYNVYFPVATSYYTWFLSDPSSATIDSSVTGNNETITVDWNTAGSYQLSVFETSSDGCIGDTVTMEVEVLPPPTISASVDTVCEGGEPVVTFELTGWAPWIIDYTDGVGNYTDTCSVTPCISILPPTGVSSTLEVTGLRDANGCVGDTLSYPTAVIQVYPEPATGLIFHD